jgi:hypothetical protein
MFTTLMDFHVMACGARICGLLFLILQPFDKYNLGHHRDIIGFFLV